MDWSQLDALTKVGVVATALALLAMVVPPLAVLSGLVGIGCSGAALQRAHSRQESNRVARLSLLVAVAVVAVIVIGNVIYAVAN